jgi:hypothetical protein
VPNLTNRLKPTTCKSRHEGPAMFLKRLYKIIKVNSSSIVSPFIVIRYVNSIHSRACGYVDKTGFPPYIAESVCRNPIFGGVNVFSHFDSL